MFFEELGSLLLASSLLLLSCRLSLCNLLFLFCCHVILSTAVDKITCKVAPKYFQKVVWKIFSARLTLIMLRGRHTYNSVKKFCVDNFRVEKNLFRTIFSLLRSLEQVHTLSLTHYVRPTNHFSNKEYERVEHTIFVSLA